MDTELGYILWLAKTRPQCIKCKAKADGIPEEEARNNHMDARNARDVQRASAWKKTVERKEVNWQLTGLNNYQKAANQKGGPTMIPQSPTRKERIIRKGTT